MVYDELSPQPFSYKDSAARVVKKEGVFYRYISNNYAKEYQHLMASGLYDKLVKKGLLISHQNLKIETSENIFTVIMPEQISFQSYPFEWSYSHGEKPRLLVLKLILLH